MWAVSSLAACVAYGGFMGTQPCFAAACACAGALSCAPVRDACSCATQVVNSHDHSSHMSDAEGPLDEIEFWRRRTVDLSGISDQLLRPGGYCHVVGWGCFGLQLRPSGCCQIVFVLSACWRGVDNRGVSPWMLDAICDRVVVRCVFGLRCSQLQTLLRQRVQELEVVVGLVRPAPDHARQHLEGGQVGGLCSIQHRNNRPQLCTPSAQTHTCAHVCTGGNRCTVQYGWSMRIDASVTQLLTLIHTRRRPPPLLTPKPV